MKAGWVVLLAAGFASDAAIAQYRWIDASGQTNYGDFPPADARDLKRVDSRAAAGADATAALPFELRRAIARYPVILYSSDDCKPCDSARVFLRNRGVPFSERLVDGSDDVSELKRLTGVETVPVLALGNQMQAGFDAAAWTRSLNAAEYPATSMLPPGYRNEDPKPLIVRAGGSAGQAAVAPSR
jgi:glutaredoxin